MHHKKLAGCIRPQEVPGDESECNHSNDSSEFLSLACHALIPIERKSSLSLSTASGYSGTYPAPCYPSHRLVFEEDGRLKAIENPSSPRLMTSIDICPYRFIDTLTLKLVKFNDDSTVPPYAILSHRWISEKEVVYAEYFQPRKETSFKSGYQKIRAACRKARQDGIRYIWIDTCCIRQGDHGDVAANVTSMYAYYQNAKVCYAYLGDISEEFDSSSSSRSRALRLLWSRWFQRGWTLQELVAPRTVIFFNKHWEWIGDKCGFRDDICLLTTIPRTVLSGEQSIQDVDVIARMTWAMRRETTRRQDGAYCLQGLLGVVVEPNYEEDYLVSFNRLGKALLDAHPELGERLGISDDLFRDPSSAYLYLLLDSKFSRSFDENLRGLPTEEEIIQLKQMTKYVLPTSLKSY
ncbi:hypothetical protein VKT23_017281 [Stygiomarasmius scandens]|uniref:Heterokaryon incompatibility domain-containing protein n=1 Tax=Marasmiellus scandens TaxID=2682957 RepID=A0ABR1IWN5_9AGAR